MPGTPRADAPRVGGRDSGFIAGSAGAVVAISVADLGPDWYPIALALTGFPCVWLGGKLYTGTYQER